MAVKASFSSADYKIQAVINYNLMYEPREQNISGCMQQQNDTLQTASAEKYANDMQQSYNTLFNNSFRAACTM